jgi:ribosomal protein S18 acetylase RimI-like enzyme
MDADQVLAPNKRVRADAAPRPVSGRNWLCHEWLSAILARTEEEGITWAVYLGAEMVGVVETVFDPEKVLLVGITALAVKPVLRRQGIGSAILRELLVSHNRLGIREHCVFIHMSNEAAHQLFERQGFVQVSELDKHGYIEYQ